MKDVDVNEFLEDSFTQSPESILDILNYTAQVCGGVIFYSDNLKVEDRLRRRFEVIHNSNEYDAFDTITITYVYKDNVTDKYFRFVGVEDSYSSTTSGRWDNVAPVRKTVIEYVSI